MLARSQALQAHTEHSRRRAVRLESTPSTTATSTATVASETTTSSAAERHFIWRFCAFAVGCRDSKGSVGYLPPSLVCMGRSLRATVETLFCGLQLRYAALSVAVEWMLRCAVQPQFEVQNFLASRASRGMTRVPPRSRTEDVRYWLAFHLYSIKIV